MRDGVGRAGLHAVSTKNTAVVIDVIHPGITLAAADTFFIGVLGCFDINAVRRTRGRTQKTRDALLQPIRVALQHVHAAVAFFEFGWPIRIVLRHRGGHHLLKGDAHPLSDSGRRTQYLVECIRHAFSFVRGWLPPGAQFLDPQPAFHSGTFSSGRNGFTPAWPASSKNSFLLNPSMLRAIVPSRPTRNSDGTCERP